MELLLILIYVSICYRHLQDVQDSGQPVVACDRDARRHHRHRAAAADHELQSSVHDQCPHLLRGDAGAAVGEGPRDRGSGAGEHAAQGRRRSVPHRSEALRVHRRSEEGSARGSRAECQAAEGLARPGDRGGRNGRTRSSSWPSRTTTGRLELFEKKVIAQATLDTFARNLETARQTLVGGQSRRGARTARLYVEHRRRQHRGRAPARRARAMPSTISSRPSPGRRRLASSRSWRCGRGCTWCRRRCGPSWCSSTPTRAIRNSGRRSSRIRLQRVKAGDDAEVAFDAVPGRVFKGKVRIVLDAIAAGQLQATRYPCRFWRANRRRPGARGHRHHRRYVGLPDPARRGRPGRDLYRPLAPRLDDTQNPAAHAQLAELYLPGGALSRPAMPVSRSGSSGTCALPR